MGPSGLAGFTAAAEQLADDAARCDRCARTARQYAETHFDIGHITERFETILAGQAVVDR